MSLTDQNEAKRTAKHSYQEGQDAYKEGIMYEQNPYKANSWDYRLWQNGWIDGEGQDMEDHGD